MSKKLYIYTIFLAIIYLVYAGQSFYQSLDAFSAGFNFAREEKPETITRGGIFGIKLSPVKGIASFPSHLTNEKTGENMRTEIREAMVFATQTPEGTPFYFKILQLGTSFFGLIVFVFFIYIPVLTFKIIKTIPQGRFYDSPNIKNIRKVSITTLAVVLCTFLSSLTMHITMRQYVEIAGYDLSFIKIDYPLLLLGMVLLILAEILHYTKEIKEEQDFTI